MKISKEEFRTTYWNMPAMKYYEGDLSKQKALDMIDNNNNNCVAMVKWDGEWNMSIIDEDETLMRGRNKTVSGDYKNRADWLPHITKQLQSIFPSGTVFLGEVSFNDITKTSKDVGTIMRCNVSKALERQQRGPLSFHIFDCLCYDYEDLRKKTFEERIQVVYDNYKQVIDYIYPVAIVKENFMDFAEKVWAKGGEGVLVIKRNEPYRAGSRKAWSSLKLKKKLGEIKVKVIDLIEPNRDHEGTSGEAWQYWLIQKNINFGEVGRAIWINEEFCKTRKMIKDPFHRTLPVTKPYWNKWKNGVLVEHEGNRIRVASGLDDATREWLATPEAAELLEKEELFVNITGMEITDDSIRHPVFLGVIK